MYGNQRKAIINCVNIEDKTDGVTIRDSIGREQKPVCINKSGVYALIFSSKLPTAKKFKHRVTSEVFSNIRKTGTYGIQPQGKELLALAVLEAQKIIEEQTQQIEEMKLKAQFANAITACDTFILN